MAVEQCHTSVLAKPYDMHDAVKIVMEKLAEKQNEAAMAGDNADSHD